MNEQSPWDQLEDGQPDTFGPDKNGVIDLTQPESEQSSSNAAEDVEPTDRPAKKRSILPFLIGIALVGVGAAGYVGYGLYQKLFPSAEVSRSGGVALIDTAMAPVPAPSMPGMDSTEAGSSLPITASNVGSSSLPISSSAQPDVDDDLAPFAAVMNSRPSTGSDAVSGSVESAVVSEPKVTVESTAPLAVAAPATGESDRNAPAVQQQIVDAPKTEAMSSPKPASVAVLPAVITPGESAAAAASKGASTKVQPSRKPATHKPVSTAEVRKKARSTAAAERSRTSSDRRAPVQSSEDLGRMISYSLLAIEPKHGAYQQAWIRDASGRVRIVGKGDVIDGARVTEVQFARGRVMTDRGEIRK